MNKCKSNLLSLNKKAFRFLHDVEGFDFKKPYFITEQHSKFTVNTVIKAVQEKMDPYKCIIVVFVVPTASSRKTGLYYATLERGKFESTRKNNVSYWDYRAKDRAGDIDYCWGVGDFEKLRKSETEKIFIVAQDKANTITLEKKNIDFSARFTLIDARKCGDGRGNTYIGEMIIETKDGSHTHFKYNPYRTFYGNEVKSGNISDFIDNSGYLLRPRRFELMQKAECLRRDRKQTEANNTDFTEQTAELQSLIDKARCVLSGSILTCIDSDALNTISDKLKTLSRVMSCFADYTDKLTAKKYASIDMIMADISRMKEKLEYCIN